MGLVASLVPGTHPVDDPLLGHGLQLLAQFLLVHPDAPGDCRDLFGLVPELHRELCLVGGVELLQDLDLHTGRRLRIPCRQLVHELPQSLVDVLTHFLPSRQFDLALHPSRVSGAGLGQPQIYEDT